MRRSDCTFDGSFPDCAPKRLRVLPVSLNAEWRDLKIEAWASRCVRSTPVKRIAICEHRGDAEKAQLRGTPYLHVGSARRAYSIKTSGKSISLRTTAKALRRMTQRIVCWFSCGVTSAVAAWRLSHDQMMTFAWFIATRALSTPTIDASCTTARSGTSKRSRSSAPTSTTTSGTFTRRQAGWSSWWRAMHDGVEKNVRRKYEQPDDIQVFGFGRENVRAERFRENNIEVNLWTR